MILTANTLPPSLKKAKQMPFALIVVCLVLLTGVDRLAIQVGASNVRVSYILFALFAIALRKQLVLSKSGAIWISLFTLLSVPSIFVSAQPLKSILYIGWIWISFLCVFSVFSTIASKYAHVLFRSLIIAYRIQILIVFALKVFDIQDRPSILYYEASYFVMSMSIYVAIVSYQSIARGNVAKVWFDLMLIGIAFYSTQSITLVFGVVAAIVCSFVALRLSLKIWMSAFATLILVASVAYVYVRTQNDLLTRRVQEIIQAENVVDAILVQSQNRAPRMRCALEVFLDHPIIGVGIGVYDSFVRDFNVRACGQGAFEGEVSETPAANIFIEVLATVGIVGATPFFAFLLSLVLRRPKRPQSTYHAVYLVAALTMLFLLLLDANYLRMYLWMVLGALHGASNLRSDSIQANNPLVIAGSR